MPLFMQPQPPVYSRQPGTRQENSAKPAMRGSSPVISDPDQEISSLERYYIWLGERYTRPKKKDLEKAAGVNRSRLYV